MNILRVLAIFINICRLRQGPQDLPTSLPLLQFTLLLYTLSSIALSLIEIPLKGAVLSSLLDVGLLVGIIGSLLYSTNYGARLPQTLTALAGTGFFFGLISHPLFYWLRQADAQNLSIDLPLFLLLVVVTWNLAVYAHVIRNALEISFPMAIVVTAIASFLATSIITAFFPPSSF